jgi:hypothetical protein
MMSGYRTQSRDTSRESERLLIEAYRSMDSVEKVRRMTELSLGCREWARAGIRSRHPEADEREVEMRLLALRLDRDTMIRLFDWDPDERGYG